MSSAMYHTSLSLPSIHSCSNKIFKKINLIPGNLCPPFYYCSSSRTIASFSGSVKKRVNMYQWWAIQARKAGLKISQTDVKYILSMNTYIIISNGPHFIAFPKVGQLPHVFSY